MAGNEGESLHVDRNQGTASGCCAHVAGYPREQDPCKAGMSGS